MDAKGIEQSMTYPVSTGSFYGNGGLSFTDRKDPHKVGQQFEAMFYRMILKTTEKDKEDDPLFGSADMSQMQEMFNDELSGTLGAQGKLGIADMIAKDIQSKETAAGMLKQQAAKGSATL